MSSIDAEKTKGAARPEHPARPARLGRIEDISSPANPRIKSLKGLALKKNREREGLFLAEGEKLVHDALEAGWSVKTLLLNKADWTAVDHPTPADTTSSGTDKANRLQGLAARVRARGGDVLTVPAKLLTTITRRDNAQSVMAAIEPKVSASDAVLATEGSVWLALDRVRDPGNLGTIIRTTDALGAKGIILIGDTTDPFSMETVRATMGSLFHVPLIRLPETGFVKLATRFKAEGGAVVGTHLAGSVDHRTLDYAAAPQLIVMGNEQQGLTDTLAQTCSSLVRIAMSGSADSLNLAVATGLVLFEARRSALPKDGGSADA
ncbi:MAG: RNA methyltransferase [Pseudomonadota bacterium]